MSTHNIGFHGEIRKIVIAPHRMECPHNSLFYFFMKTYVVGSH